MITFTKEELKHIAHLSALALSDDEIQKFASQLGTVLTYASELDEVSVTSGNEKSGHNINVFRDDRLVPCASEAVLSQAPATEDTFFVVPKIL